MLNTNSVGASLYILGTDLINWWAWLNTHLESESFSSVTWSDQLTRLAEHIQEVSHPSVFDLIWLTDEAGWTPIQLVSPFPVFDLIQSTDKVHWTPIQWVSHSPVFGLI